MYLQGRILGTYEEPKLITLARLQHRFPLLESRRSWKRPCICFAENCESTHAMDLLFSRDLASTCPSQGSARTQHHHFCTEGEAASMQRPPPPPIRQGDPSPAALYLDFDTGHRRIRHAALPLYFMLSGGTVWHPNIPLVWSSNCLLPGMAWQHLVCGYICRTA